MRRSAWAVAGAASLGLLFVLAACPSLDQIRVGGAPLDATVDPLPPHPRPDAGGGERREATTNDAAADGDLDATCDADVRSDPQNCGHCSHDCLGGACSGGACQPVLIYRGDTPTGIVVDGPNLVVTVQTASSYAGYVFRCTAADCQATQTLLATELANPWIPVKQGPFVYWVDFGAPDAAAPSGVFGCPETGCSDAGSAIYTVEDSGSSNVINFTGVAADSTHLYWATSSAVSAEVYGCAASACAGTVAHLGSGFGVPYSLLIDKSQLYWLNLGTNQILRCSLPSCGGNPEIVASIASAGIVLNLSGLAVHGGDAYWTVGYADGGVFHCPTSGCTAPKVIATDQGDPSFVAVDDSGVYWVSHNNGTISTCPLTGCAKPTVLARVPFPFMIALDEVSVYIANAAAYGSIVRVAK